MNGKTAYFTAIGFLFVVALLIGDLYTPTGITVANDRCDNFTWETGTDWKGNPIITDLWVYISLRKSTVQGDYCCGVACVKQPCKYDKDKVDAFCPKFLDHRIGFG